MSNFVTWESHQHTVRHEDDEAGERCLLPKTHPVHKLILDADMRRRFRQPLAERVPWADTVQEVLDEAHRQPTPEQRLAQEIDRTFMQGLWPSDPPLPDVLVVKPEAGDGSRKDANKTSGFWLIPQRPLWELARLYAIGAKKYTPRGWEKGMAWSRVLDPVFRHIGKWVAGEKYDPVDGQHHLAAAVWGLFALMEYEATHPELDDIHPNNED